MNIWLFVFISGLIAVVSSIWTDLDLESIESVSGPTSRPFYADLKTKRIGRGLYGVSGTMTFNDDSSKYTGEIALFYSAKGNGEWTGTPINLAPAPLCDKYNQEYRKFVMKPLASASDMPDADSGDLCEIFEQKTYTVTGYEIKGKSIPRFLQAGHYKVVISIREAAAPNDVTSDVHIIFRLT